MTHQGLRILTIIASVMSIITGAISITESNAGIGQKLWGAMLIIVFGALLIGLLVADRDRS